MTDTCRLEDLRAISFNFVKYVFTFMNYYTASANFNSIYYFITNLALMLQNNINHWLIDLLIPA